MSNENITTTLLQNKELLNAIKEQIESCIIRLELSDDPQQLFGDLNTAVNAVMKTQGQKLDKVEHLVDYFRSNILKSGSDPIALLRLTQSAPQIAKPVFTVLQQSILKRSITGQNHATLQQYPRSSKYNYPAIFASSQRLGKLPLVIHELVKRQAVRFLLSDSNGGYLKPANQTPPTEFFTFGMPQDKRIDIIYIGDNTKIEVTNSFNLMELDTAITIQCLQALAIRNYRSKVERPNHWPHNQFGPSGIHHHWGASLLVYCQERAGLVHDFEEYDNMCLTGYVDWSSVVQKEPFSRFIQAADNFAQILFELYGYTLACLTVEPEGTVMGSAPDQRILISNGDGTHRFDESVAITTVAAKTRKKRVTA